MSDPETDSSRGIMLYGYSKEGAVAIRDAVSQGLGSPVDLLSASGMEGAKVSGILDVGGSDIFTEADCRVLMFLGFDDAAIGRTMDHLRGFPGIVRPIFCCLTEENVNWTLKDLIEDLRAEDRYWKERRESTDPDKLVP